MIKYLLIDINANPVLGRTTCVKLNLIERTQQHNYNCHEVIQEIHTLPQLITKYHDIFKGIGCIKQTIHLELRSDVKPVIHAPRKVPISIRNSLKRTLCELADQNIISKINKPTEWVNSLLIKVKKNNTLRICIDPRDLNVALKRQHYKIPTAEEIITKMHKMKYFTVLDQQAGYWNVPLDEESSDLCTFNTPFGRYKFNRLPFGISVAPEVFQKVNDDIFGDLDFVGISTDDFIIGGTTKQDCIANVIKVLDRARNFNIHFNPDKIQFCLPEVKYLGCVVTANGTKIAPEKLKAIMDLKTPQNKGELRSIMGYINYLLPYIPNLADLTNQMRQLINEDISFVWDANLEVAFKKLKEVIKENHTLTHFDPSLKIIIQSDASQHGLGAVLTQEGKPICYTSRALREHEQRYSQIEKELLAIVHACEKFHHFIYGYSVIIHTDHKPLLAIVKKPFDKITNRLQNFVLKLQKYDVELCYKAGKKVFIADMLSRNHPDVSSEDDGKEQFESHILELKHILSSTWYNKITNAMSNDEESKQLIELISQGWPVNNKSLPVIIRKYGQVKDKLKFNDGLITYENKIFIPKSLRHDILELLHEGHQGIEKSKARARQTIYWCGITKDIETLVSSCSICLQFRNNNPKESLIPHKIPHIPWKKIAIDIFEIKGTSYLMLVDYYSRYPEVIKLQDQTAETVIKSCKETFARHGIPEKIICDNMPFGSVAYTNFCKEWDITLCTSSPKYPQSNGMAERHIQSIKKKFKKALIKDTDIELVLLEHRNTPLTDLEYSPSQLLMGRLLRGKIPMLYKNLKPMKPKHVMSKIKNVQAKQKKQFDKTSRNLSQLTPNQNVMLKTNKTWKPAKVISKADQPRSYYIKNQLGHTLRRNRRHLIPIKERPDNEPIVQNTRVQPGQDQNSSNNDIVNNVHGNSNSTYHNTVISRIGRKIITPIKLLN